MRKPSFWIVIILWIGMGTITCSDNPGTANTGGDAELVVETLTTGDNPNPSRYTILVPGSGNRDAAANDRIEFTNLEAGTFQIDLTNIAGHYKLNGDNPRTHQLTDGAVSTVVFEIHCATILRNQIVFLNNQDRVTGLYKMNPDGSDMARVADYNMSSVWRPAIPPDGTKIAFVATESGSGTQQIWLVDSDGSGRRELFKDDTILFRKPSWSPIN